MPFIIILYMQKRNPLLDFHPRVGSPETIWIIPFFYILLALALGYLVPRMDVLLVHQQSFFRPGAAASLLSSIASGMITFTGFVFSMLFVMVQFGSSAYTPRLARYFLQDPIIAHSLGIFTATFIYSILALSQVDYAQTGVAPDYTVAVAMAFVLSSTVVFLLLIRRTTTLQINSVLHMLGVQSARGIQALYPLLPGFTKPGTLIPSDAQLSTSPAQEPADPESLPPIHKYILYTGRPQRVVEFRLQELVNHALKADVMLQVLPAVGDMVDDNQPIIIIRGQPHGKIHEEQLRRSIKMGPQRTMEQDPKFAIRMIADIAIRALSPAVNDPTTAVQALDEIDDLLRRIAIRDLNIGSVFDAAGVLRVIYPTPDWDDFLNLSINEIRHYGASSIQVMRRLRALLSDLRQFAPQERVPAIEHQLGRVDATIARSFEDPDDQEIAREPDRQGISIVK